MHSPDLLQAQLRALGVRAGDVLMVHASLRRLGPVHGRADGVIDAILGAVGEGGTMLMVLDAIGGVPFDAATTPVDVDDMGWLAEIFRRRPETVVNDHVSARCAAVGPHADALLDAPPLHDYLGPGSFLERLVKLDGRVLRLGADTDTVTLTHYAEYLATVPNKRRVRRTLTRADTGEQVVECLDDNDGIRDWKNGDYFSQILLDYTADGAAPVGPVGDCTAELLNARSFVAFAVSWMELNLTDEDCE